MAENMAVWLEIWPVAADEHGIWLVSGKDAWRPCLPVASDDEPHAELELELATRGALEQATLVHSTSWRAEGQGLTLTYAVVLHRPGLALDGWPEALPIDLPLIEMVGKPIAHRPTDPPTPRHVDVLMHALRHLRLLMAMDASAATALVDPWPRHLQRLQPALAGMYDEVSD